MNRNPPKEIKLELRQESNFGCAVCGCPILEYHHIVPWSVCKEHAVDNLVALCPTHHTLLGKASPDEARSYKLNPYNQSKSGITNKFVNGCNTNTVKMGAIFLNDCNPILQAFDQEILVVESQSGHVEINAFFPNADFLPELKISQNSFIAKTQGLYDVEFRGNYLKIRKRKGKNFITIDLRKDIPEIYFDIQVLGSRHFHTRNKSSVGDKITVKPGGRWNINANGMSGGILIGDQSYKVVPTNHAAGQPMPAIIKKPMGHLKKSFGVILR